MASISQYKIPLLRGVYYNHQLVTDMAVEETRSTEPTEDGLSDDVVESVTAQEQGGSIMISIPADQVRDLGISKGDSVLIVGEEGDRSLRVGRADSVIRV